MLQKLKYTPQYCSIFNTETGDITIHANPDGTLKEDGYFQVMVTGENNPHYENRTVKGSYNHKRIISLYLKTTECNLSPNSYDIDKLNENDYDGIIRDHISSLKREYTTIKTNNDKQRTKTRKELQKKRITLELHREKDLASETEAEIYEPKIVEAELKQAYIELNALNNLINENEQPAKIQAQIQVIQSLIRPQNFIKLQMTKYNCKTVEELKKELKI